MFHSNQQEAQGVTGCGKDKQHYERNDIMPKVGKKKFPYTAAGMKAAKKEKEKIKGYKEGGSVSRGQYPSQDRKVKFKGVF